MGTNKYPFTQNRELSWLRFNDRVLSEAMDETLPLLERLKFISIFTSNLDEFFMIRVGSLFDMMHVKAHAIDNKSGMTPKEQLEHIYRAVRPLCEKRDKLFGSIQLQLRAHGVSHLAYTELESVEQKYVKQYFKSSVLPILSPQIVDTHHPFPHLQNKVLHVCAMLKFKNKQVFAVIPVPQALPEVLFLPGIDVRYIRMEDIILEFMDQVFDNYTVDEKVCICITRNADINPDDEAFDVGSDFRKKMKKVLGQRRRLAPVRMEISHSISEHFISYLCEHLTLTPAMIYTTSAPMTMGYVFSLADKLTDTKRKALTYPVFKPQYPARIHKNESILRQVQKKDILLSYPFESMEPFLQMIKEASNDPTVISIKITIYRLARKTKLVEYLCNAAENGKDVTVLIELRARFDEQNNIDWSERLEEAGCTIIYGFEDYKVHSKLCLITKKERGEIQYITQIGTGNYNEKTAEMYTDLSLLTANQDIGQDANIFFQNMGIGNLMGSYKNLLVAPVSLKTSVMRLIDEEIAKGNDGRIFLKLNSLTDIDIIEKLKEASCAGVQIQMMIRGICCLLPQVPGMTENIRVFNVVGRYLEHSRIYCFGSGKNEKMYISSADFMTRNTERRVEVAAPVYDPDIQAQIHNVMDAAKADNVKARILCADGEYIKKPFTGTAVDSQQLLMQQAQQQATTPSEPPQKEGFFARLRHRIFK